MAKEAIIIFRLEGQVKRNEGPAQVNQSPLITPSKLCIRILCRFVIGLERQATRITMMEGKLILPLTTWNGDGQD